MTNNGLFISLKSDNYLTIRTLVLIIVRVMSNRGRPPKPRYGELGRYLEEQRTQKGWTVSQLADAAHIPLKTLSKLELGLIKPRKPGIFSKLAIALDIHQDRLLLKASLTPTLRPATNGASSIPKSEQFIAFVNAEERLQLENYLQFLRYMAHIETLSHEAETSINP